MGVVNENVVYVVLENGRLTGRIVSSLLIPSLPLSRDVNAYYTVGKYPLVNTFSNDVFPQAPSPLQCRQLVPTTESLARIAHPSTYSNTSFLCTVFVPPQSGILLSSSDLFRVLCPDPHFVPVAPSARRFQMLAFPKRTSDADVVKGAAIECYDRGAQ